MSERLSTPGEDLIAAARRVADPQFASPPDIAAREEAFGYACASFLVGGGQRPSLPFMHGLGRAVGEMIAQVACDCPEGVANGLYEVFTMGIVDAIDAAGTPAAGGRA